MSRRNQFERDETEDEIDLIDLISLLIRRWKLIMGTAVPVIVLGLIFAMTRPNIYRAEATLMVSSGQIYSINNLDNLEISKNQKLASSYVEIAKSRSIIRNVVKKLDLDMEPENMANLLIISPINGTEFIKISYKDKNPLRSALLVNEISNEFISKIKKVMTFENLKIIEKAEIPQKSLPKKRSFILLISIVLGIILGIFIAFILEILNNKLRKPEDIEKIMECSILANIPDFNLKNNEI